jgi:hypothetical protein
MRSEYGELHLRINELLEERGMVKQGFVRIWIFLEQISISTVAISLCGWM